MDCCICYNDIWKPCFVSYQGFKLLRLRLSSSSWSLILQKITIDNYGWYDHNCGRDVIIETSEIFTLWSKLQSWILLLVILALVLLLSFCLFLLCMKESYKSFVFCELERERERVELFILAVAITNGNGMFKPSTCNGRSIIKNIF